MHSTTVAVDLAKDVIEVAVAGREGRVERRDRLGRDGFTKFLVQQTPSRIVMEACGGAHFWARKAQAERLTENDPSVQAVRQVSGIGLLTSTALVASAVDARNFRNGRHLASWIGLTPR